jgi:hypothetical protein
MKKPWVPIITFVSGFLFIYLGSEYEIPLLIHFALIPIGFAVLVWGVEAIKEKHSNYAIGEVSSATRDETFTGFAAMADGLVLAVVGFVIICSGIIFLLGLGGFFIEFIRTHPGIIFVLGGLLTAAYGITLILGSQQSNRNTISKVASLPKRFFGLILFGLGICAILLGILEIFDHTSYASIIVNIKNSYLSTFPDY